MNFISDDFFLPFISILLAELGDKTQLALFLFSSRIAHPYRFLLGALFGFLIVDGTAILAGNWLGSFIPIDLLRIVSSILFMGFGIWLAFQKLDEGQAKTPEIKYSWTAGFSLIFMMEWGDKTQLASALFAANYAVILVFSAVMSALTLLSTLTVVLGRKASRQIKPFWLTKISALLFILIGFSILVASLRPS